MREIDLLAEALVEAAAHIIALPLKIAGWVAKAAKRLLKKPHFVGLGQWKKTASKRKLAKAAKKGGNPKASALDKFKLHFEDMPPHSKGGKVNAKLRRSRNRK